MKDGFDLERFVTAQESLYETAYEEICRGAKESCWMWFIFPQLKGLGRSETAKFYGICGEEEARAYLEHPVLGERLIQCCEALLQHGDKTALQIFGSIDAVKLRSCMTLFEAVSCDPLFDQVLQTFFDGKKDGRTLALLEN